MGILDSVLASSAFKQVVGQVEAAAVPIVLHEVLGNDSQGGINTILDKRRWIIARDSSGAAGHAP